MARIFQEFDKISPMTHPVMGSMSTSGRCYRGLAHLLGITVEATVCFSLPFVVAFQNFCWKQVATAKCLGADAEARTTKLKLWWLYAALNAVMCFLFLLRPSDFT